MAKDDNYENLDFIEQHLFRDDLFWEVIDINFFKLDVKRRADSVEVGVSIDDAKMKKAISRANAVIANAIIRDFVADPTPEGIVARFGDDMSIIRTIDWDVICNPQNYDPEFAAKMAKVFEKLAAVFHQRSLEKVED